MATETRKTTTTMPEMMSRQVLMPSPRLGGGAAAGAGGTLAMAERLCERKQKQSLSLSSVPLPQAGVIRLPSAVFMLHCETYSLTPH